MWLHIGDKLSASWWMIMKLFIFLTIINVLLCPTINGQDLHYDEGDSCRTRDEESGICRRIDECEIYVEALRKRTIKYSFIVRCGFVQFTEIVCCPQNASPPPPTTTTTTVKPIAATLPVGSSCNTKIGEAGICQPVTTCEPYYEGPRSGKIQPRSIVLCSSNRVTPVICCPKDITPPTPPTPPTLTTTTVQPTPVIPVEGDICKTRNDQAGICTPTVACESYSEGLRSGIIPYSSLVVCKYSGDTEVICCPKKSTARSTTTTTVRPKTIGLPEGSNCKATNAEAGICIPIKACKRYYDGLRSRRISFASLVLCSFNGGTLVICCPLVGTPPTLTTTTVKPTIIIPVKDTKCNTKNCVAEIYQPVATFKPLNEELRSGKIRTPVIPVEGDTCKTRNDEAGICTPMLACEAYSEGFKMGIIPYTSLVVCKYSGYTEVICCPTKSTAPSTITTTVRPMTIGLPLGSNCDTQNGEKGICTLVTACQAYNEGIKSRTIASKSIVNCSFSGATPVICCPLWGTRTILTTTTVKPTPVEGGKCNTKNGEAGICQPVTTCEPYYEGLRSRKIQPRSLVLCSKNGTIPVVCCPPKDTPHTTTVTPPITTVTPPRRRTFCNTKNGEAGYCTEINACQPYYEGLRSRTIQHASLVFCSFSGAVEEICCPQNLRLPVTTTSTQAPEITINNFNRPSQEACRKWQQINPASLNISRPDGTAGASGHYPHVGAVMTYYSDVGFEVLCTASLISERFALTTASCVSDNDQRPAMLRFGELGLNAQHTVNFDIENITIHGDYRPPLLYNNIALIKLDRDVNFSAFILPACLYFDKGDITRKTTLTVASVIMTEGQSDVLWLADRITMPYDACHKEMVEYGVSRANKDGVHRGQYCVVYKNGEINTCDEDNGSPIQLVEDKISTIVGIFSSCNFHPIYTRVAFYLDWIEFNVWPV